MVIYNEILIPNETARAAKILSDHHSSNPPFLKGGLEFPKIDWKGGFENFCRKGVESWKGGVDLEKGGLIDFPLISLKYRPISNFGAFI